MPAGLVVPHNTLFEIWDRVEGLLKQLLCLENTDLFFRDFVLLNVGEQLQNCFLKKVGIKFFLNKNLAKKFFF